MNRSLNDLSRSEWVYLIDEWIFSERDRAILKRKLLDGVSYDDLSEEFRLSVRRLKTIVYKGTERIAAHLDRTGRLWYK